MIKRFLAVAVPSVLLGLAAWVPSGIVTAGEDPPVHDDPHGEPHCAAMRCW